MFLFWLLLAGTLQVVCPPWRHMAQPPFPFLLTVVLYAALRKPPLGFVLTAIVAGIIEDAMSLAHIGTSSSAFLAAGAFAFLVRPSAEGEIRFGPVLWRGALCAAVATAAMALLLRLRGFSLMPFPALCRRMLGAALLGALLAPVQCWLMDRLEGLLGTRTPAPEP